VFAACGAGEEDAYYLPLLSAYVRAPLVDEEWLVDEYGKAGLFLDLTYERVVEAFSGREASADDVVLACIRAVRVFLRFAHHEYFAVVLDEGFCREEELRLHRSWVLWCVLIRALFAIWKITIGIYTTSITSTPHMTPLVPQASNLREITGAALFSTLDAFKRSDPKDAYDAAITQFAVENTNPLIGYAPHDNDTEQFILAEALRIPRTNLKKLSVLFSCAPTTRRIGFSYATESVAQWQAWWEPNNTSREWRIKLESTSPRLLSEIGGALEGIEYMLAKKLDLASSPRTKAAEYNVRRHAQWPQQQRTQLTYQQLAPHAGEVKAMLERDQASRQKRNSGEVPAIHIPSFGYLYDSIARLFS
jgi:hypothetical protein